MDQHLIDSLKEGDLLLTLAQRDTTLRQKTANELSGPCPVPGCGRDQDGFNIILRSKITSAPRFYCRGGHSGDVFEYCKLVYGWPFKEVLQRFGEQPKLNRSRSGPVSDRKKYAQAIETFVQASCQSIWTEAGNPAIAWLKGRGLTEQTIARAHLGYNLTDRWDNPEDWGYVVEAGRVFLPRGIVILNNDTCGFHYLKIRRPTGNPKYHIVKGGQGWIFGGDTLRNTFTAFLFESELDALLGWQTGLGCGFIALPAGNTLHKEWDPLFTSIEEVIVCADEDKEGRNHAAKLCTFPHFFPACPLPHGKDLTEFCQAGRNVLDYLCDQLEEIQLEIEA